MAILRSALQDYIWIQNFAYITPLNSLLTNIEVRKAKIRKAYLIANKLKKYDVLHQLVLNGEDKKFRPFTIR